MNANFVNASMTEWPDNGKSVEEYLKDLRITGDAEMMKAPQCIRKIHAIRLKIQDEEDSMKPNDRIAYLNHKYARYLANSQV